MKHEFEVIKLWEQPTNIFLRYEGLLPLAVLSQTPDRAETLRQVSAQIDQIKVYNRKANIAASTGILAGLSLERDFIHQVLRRDLMQQSVIYQEIQQESRQIGKEEGKLEEAVALVLRQLSRRIGNVSPELESQIKSLSLTEIEDLGEALLDFSETTDLENWLQNR